MSRKVIYEHGPDKIAFGPYEFNKGQVRDDLPDQVVDQLVRKGRVREVFDFPPPLMSPEKKEEVSSEEKEDVINLKKIKGRR